MPDICIVGEAWGREEEIAREPFVGWSGRLLNHMLAQVGINRKDCFVTNVLNLRPHGNDIKTLCGPKSLGVPSYPALTKGKYLRKEFLPELQRLYKEIESVKPNLIIGLGATAAWALLRTSGITRVRGTSFLSPIVNRKVLCTYHPAALARDWALRPIMLADLEKCARESRSPVISRPQREIWIRPVIADLEAFERRHIADSSSLSVDIETWRDQITCIGFAPGGGTALVIPFLDRTRPDKNYWTFEEEVLAWKWIRKVLNSEKQIIGQNFLYDTNFLIRQYRIPVVGAHDTMLLHHSLYPELPKGLGFLGSVYTDEVNWKVNRDHSTIKREDT